MGAGAVSASMPRNFAARKYPVKVSPALHCAGRDRNLFASAMVNCAVFSTISLAGKRFAIASIRSEKLPLDDVNCMASISLTIIRSHKCSG